VRRTDNSCAAAGATRRPTPRLTTAALAAHGPATRRVPGGNGVRRRTLRGHPTAWLSRRRVPCRSSSRQSASQEKVPINTRHDWGQRDPPASPTSIPNHSACTRDTANRHSSASPICARACGKVRDEAGSGSPTGTPSTTKAAAAGCLGPRWPRLPTSPSRRARRHSRCRAGWWSAASPNSIRTAKTDCSTCGDTTPSLPPAAWTPWQQT